MLSKRGSALLVGLVIVILVTILAVSFLEKVMRIAEVSGSIGFSTESYTLATGLIEEQLMSSTVNKKTPWNLQNINEGSVNSFAQTGRTLQVATGGTMIPKAKKGNSEFDADWNIISLGDPIQIVIPSGITWSSVLFQFRVPNIPGSSSTGATNASSGIILWTFGYSGASLYASGETNIFSMGDVTGMSKRIDSYNGITNLGVSSRFDNFYTSYGSSCGNYQCTLKLSMIRPFTTNGGQAFPFLEYKISGFNTMVPSQYMVIDSQASIRGYLRSRQVRIPQITTDTAADFAVLQ